MVSGTVNNTKIECLYKSCGFTKGTINYYVGNSNNRTYGFLLRSFFILN